MKTFYTADPHFSREGTNVLSRPFATPLEMSETILEAINSRITRNDRLLIAGDFSFREPAYWRTRLCCHNAVLVIGNHDSRAKSREAFGEVGVRDAYDTHCKEHPCYISHYPHAYWPKSHRGAFHLFGHVHDQRTETLDAVFPTMRSMDCGVDAAKRILGNYTCFSEDEIYDLLIQKPGYDSVEFYIEQRGEYKKDHA